MNRLDEFEQSVCDLIDKYNDIPYKDLEQSFRYFSKEMNLKANRQWKSQSQ